MLKVTGEEGVICGSKENNKNKNNSKQISFSVGFFAQYVILFFLQFFFEFQSLRYLQNLDRTNPDEFEKKKSKLIAQFCLRIKLILHLFLCIDLRRWLHVGLYVKRSARLSVK